jgi:phage/plasmid primase-like uncharacterized protein
VDHPVYQRGWDEAACKEFERTRKFPRVGAPNGAATLQRIAVSLVVVIAEDDSTATTIAKHGKMPALAAYASGNLLAVTKSTRDHWPEKRIIIAGDDDH